MIDFKVGPEIWALSISTFFNRASGFLSLFAAIFFTTIGLSASSVTMALLVVGIAGVLGSLAGGNLADRFGKARVLISSTVLNAFFFAALSFVDFGMGIVVVALAASSVFLSQAFIGPASAIVANSSTSKNRVTRFAFYRIFINVGCIVAPALVGVIGREHFSSLFLISSICSLLVPVLLWCGLKGIDAEDPPLTGIDDSAPEPRLAGKIADRTMALWLVYVSMGIAMIIYAQHQSAVPLKLNDIPGGVGLYSVLLIINPVIVIALEYPLSHLTKRLRGSFALAMGLAIMTIGVCLTGSFAQFAAIAIVGWVLFSIGECVFAPMSNTYVAEISSPERQSRSQSQLAAFQSVGAALGPAIGSGLFTATGDKTWLLLVVGGLAAIILIFFSQRSFQKEGDRHHVSFAR